ncbi:MULTISPECIES: NrsF family protein [unclassified Anaeromyxobacter]|uniref:NrsF family protein n=1 Tax=unclassified Anaeromyxobacter TaxID=2620896 RepID=UPI001F57548A|nr:MULTISPECIES: NrsF family protein [unclassified Anaeromyxobacter]
MMPPESLKMRVLEAVRQHPVPRRTDPLPFTIGLAAFAAVAMSGVLLWVPPLFGEVAGLAHAAGRPASSGAWILAGTVALALASTWLVLPSRRSMLSPPRGLLLAVAIGVPLLVGAWLVLWHGTYADPFTRVGWRCFALTALTAPWPFATLAYASRRVEPRHPGTAGAALGSVAGAWAAVMVELWCPLATGSHVLLGHVLPLLVLALAGSAFGVRLFRLPRV